MELAPASPYAVNGVMKSLPSWLRFGLRMLPRFFWAALLGIHIPITAAALRSLVAGDVSAGGLFVLAILLLSSTFFALKFIDVRWLRWRSRPAAMIAFALVCAIVHRDVIGNTSEHSDFALQTVELMTVVSAAGLAFRRRLLEVVRRIGALLAAANAPIAMRRFCASLIDRCLPGEMAFVPAAIPRAPPH